MTTPCPRRGKACEQQNKTCLGPFCSARLGSASLGLGGLGFWSARLWFEARAAYGDEDGERGPLVDTQGLAQDDHAQHGRAQGLGLVEQLQQRRAW